MSVRRAVFLRQKAAPQRRLDAHHVKIIAADQFTPDDLCALAVAGIAAFAGTDGRRNLIPYAEIGKASISVAQIYVVRVRKSSPNSRVCFPAPMRSDQFR